MADLEENVSSEKQRLVMVRAPRSVVLHGQGEAAYLFRYKSPFGFASFALDGHTILTTYPRYNDPMDPKSGRRKSLALLSGWQGVAEIIESTVRHSPNWKNFQTVEASRKKISGHGSDRSTYEVWATPRKTRVIEWCGEGSAPGDVPGGSIIMPKSVPVLLARADVSVRLQDDGLTIEEIVSLDLYPHFAGEELYFCESCDDDGEYFDPPIVHCCNWQRTPGRATTCRPKVLTPMVVDMSDQSLLRFCPHDELKIDLYWGKA